MSFIWDLLLIAALNEKILYIGWDEKIEKQYLKGQTQNTIRILFHPFSKQ